MRVALFHNIPAGGAKRTLFEQVKYLSKKHTIDFYTLSSNKEGLWNIGSYVKNVYTENFKIKDSQNRIIKDFKNFIILNRVHKNIANQINKRDYDVVLTHPDYYTGAPFILRYLKFPVLYFCHEYLRVANEPHLHRIKDINTQKWIYELFTRHIRKSIDKNNILAASGVITNSKFTSENLKKAYSINSTNCLLGTDNQVFKKIIKKRKNKLLFIGDKNYIKGFDFAIKVINELKKNVDVELKVFETSKTMMENSDKKLAEEYSNSLATLCVARREPFGLSAIESMACETPVLAVNEGGYKETVLSGKTGFLLEREVDEFVEKVKYLIDNPDISDMLGRNGRNHVKNNFTWENHCECLENKIREIVENENNN